MQKGRWVLLIGAAVTALPPFAVTPAVAHSERCPDVLTAPVERYALPSGTGGVAGLVASPRYPGWGWMVRQHKPPYLYAIRFPGGRGPHEVRAFRVLGVHKLDWGDLVYQNGKLLIVESDQPWTRTRPGQIRVIHEIPEPDPHGSPAVRPSAQYRYAYPDGQRHNTEAAFSFDGHLVLVPKTTPAKLYRFDQPLSTQRVNRPRRVASLAGSDTASMAAVSPDRLTLVLANHRVLFVYRLPYPARYLHQFAGRPAQRRQINTGDNVEAGGFFPAGRCKLLLAAKSRTVYRILGNP